MSDLVIAGGLKRTGPGAVDPYYDGGSGVGYANLAAAYAAIAVPVRNNKTFIVVTAGVPAEWWWQGTNTANGQEVLKTAGGGGGSGIGPWAAVPSKNAYIVNEDIDFEYNNGTNCIFLRGQFKLNPGFVGATILLGILPTGNYPKAQLKKLILCNGIYAFVTVDTTGNISLVSRDGFNLPTSAQPEPYTIETFYKPVTGGGAFNVFGFNGIGIDASVTVQDNSSAVVLTQTIPASSGSSGYVNPAGALFSVTVTYPAGTTSLTCNSVGTPPNIGGGTYTFTNVNQPINIQIS